MKSTYPNDNKTADHRSAAFMLANSRKLFRHLAIAALAGIATSAQAAPRSYTGSSITENFDGLGASGTVITTLTGWDAGQFNPQQSNQPGPGNGIATVTDTSVVVDDGTLAQANGTASIFNFGTTGNTDRALGSMPKTATQDLFYQMAIKNDSGNAITSLVLTYTGEQWASGPSTIADTLTVWFSDNNATSGFVSMSAFSFTAPQMNLNTKLDGNAAANRTVITGTFMPPSPIAPGNTFYIRWYDRNDGDQDDGLGIDDLTVTPSTASIPSVTLGVGGSPLAEAAGVATVTATLSATHTQDVTVNLAFSGTATVTTDYTPSASSILIPAGQTQGSITLTAVQDSLWETGGEVIVVDISTVVNGVESGTQQVTATITDDDVQPSGILFDTASSASAGTASSIAWSHTVRPGSNRMLVVGVATERNSDEYAATVNYGSQALAKVPGSRASQGTPYNTTELWYLPSPTVGTADITVTFATSIANGMDCGAVSLFGVDQGLPENVVVATGAGSGGSYSLGITTYSDGAWLVDVVNNGTGGSSFTPGTGMTERWDRNGSGQMAAAGATREVVTAGTVTDTWTTGGTSRRAQSIAAFASASPKMLTFGLADNPATITGTAITLYVPTGTNVTNLGPAFTFSPEDASCTVNDNPAASGSQYNFTSPVHYILQSADLVSDYTVTVVFAPVETTIVWNTGSGDWNHSTANWLGQASQQLTPFYNGQNVIFNNSAGGTIAITADMEPASTTVNAASGTYTFTGGPLSGTGPITKSGGGILKINGSTGASCAVGVSEGTLAGIGPIGGAVTLSGTGGIDLRDGATATLPLGSLQTTGDAGANILSFDLGNNTAATDQLAVSGTVTVTHPVTIRLKQLGWPSNRVTAGTYDLITTTTGTMPAVSNFVLEATSAYGQTFSLALDVTQQKLQLTTTRVTSATATAFWSGESDANWSTVANWRTAVSAGSPTAGAPDYATNVTFNTTDPVANYLLTNTLDRDFDINGLTFATTATSPVTIAGNNKKLTIEGGGITANTPTSGTVVHTIGAQVGLDASQTWAVNPSATLTVNGAVTDLIGAANFTKTGTGTLNLNGNTMIGGDLKIGNLASCGSIVVGSGKSISIGSGSTTNLYLSYQANNGYICNGTIDASAAANVNINVGNAYIGTAGSMVGNSTGTLNLGANSTITASTLLAVGTSLWDVGSYGILTVAAGGVAQIHTPTMQVGWATANGTSGGFGTVTLGTDATMTLDGIAGGRTTLLIGYDDEQYGRSSSGTMDLVAGTASLKLSSLVVGHQNGNAGTPGILTLGTSASNHLDISGAGNVVKIGDLGLFGTDASGWTTGTVTIGNLDATSAITSTDNSTAILIGNRVASASGSCTGTLNLNGGTLTITTTGTAIGSGGSGGTSNLNLNGGVTLKAGASSATWIQGLTSAKIKSGGVVIDTNSNAITVPQALLADATSTGGGLTKSGAGTLTLGGVNTYAGNTTVANGTLVLADNAGLKFVVTNASSNKVTGSGTATFDGDFTIDTSAVTATSGSWTLVNTNVKSFTTNFTVTGGGVWSEVSNIWTYTDLASNIWRFDEATGTLTLNIEPGGYSAWASGFTAPPLSNIAANADPDGDGLANAIEYVIGSDPRYSNAGGLSVGTNSGNLVLTFSRSDASEPPDVALMVEVSADLDDWSSLPNYTVGATTGTSSAGVEVLENDAADDTITVTIPQGANARLFGRLRVIVTQ